MGAARRRLSSGDRPTPDYTGVVTEEQDYRAQYNEAIARAVSGQVGVYPDFDRHRQEQVWRVLSSDRQALLTFCQRHGISVGRMETIKTLKSPKPLYQLMAVGQDAKNVAKWVGTRG
jgi:hypothetical protein